ncbi:MAG: UDP-N-acetylglucosamine 1-carboxyvinyltransferase [Candidatus Magasanikbacteria bacterium GW2011_GWD2_43_18]|uniref:UDP-N-acetylglucosamine 1-carboxyvinyltransferase n=1 Tax=Candidatus Magasanikbacteria bacterium GW2011_GWE2_42_7 TaxID=1619052 RepID=A0A0G1E667_9BACT|nr:MAG: UDP-N-acetylglucosamine 1-carboxyvinyltransferase [Candidatus Magasanikbacteria bacterium GW2011_GWC2_42_27]KKS70053.1 MAG: UDP-N-acetylglucosamine 1-carboxyvinyltransferase [Candidatus Magasanikbacteria bacterium GW2011_GWE2_42_7]KKT04434.1 MAG: UDP-N-acetylglucosamine 1-carboxyvinyltransferase [Candidatus Magasanikbacteria bacterium GW2011_GWD2_43_18]KKT26055.1 MAG: UDP-N-acetylglucosamine 1-carboxyvinyltransferase [Candidatus Magasanikbacteria bacterium GW2011_GWA2_43_9]HBB37662.1 UD
MSRFVIQGGTPLEGKVETIGNKNAVLKMIAAALLTEEEVHLSNVPGISDVDVMLEMLEALGAQVRHDKEAKEVSIIAKEIKTTTVPAELAKKLRSSNVLLGPLLVRMGHVESVVPGGDKIGPREMTAHFDGLTALGATFKTTGEEAFSLSGKLTGTNVHLYEPSVTATENVIMAAVLAKGKTVITNAASEPQVKELCLMLNTMGANITGGGSNEIHITGVEALHGTSYAVPIDYIYAGTFVILAAITGGRLEIGPVNHEDMRTMLYFFAKLGVKTEAKGDMLIVPEKQTLRVQDQDWARVKGFYSQPWPCFPSDIMSLAIVLATQVEGSVLFFEKMYPGRMFFADYLNGMGANIIIADPHRVIVNGKTPLVRRTLASPDLRAGMAYVAAGLCAEGETIVENIRHIDRGYPEIEKVLTALGATITREES